MPNENLQASCSAIWYSVLLQVSRADQMFSPQVLGTHPWTAEAVLFPASWHYSVLLQLDSSARSRAVRLSVSSHLRNSGREKVVTLGTHREL